MSVIDILKPHNLEAFEEINKMLESGKKKIAVPRATGSGKTFLMGALAEKYSSDKKIVLEPTKPLLDSIKEKFDEFGIENTDFITYQKLIRMSDEDIAEMDYKLIFLDECHHGTAPKWGQKIRHLMETHSDSIICGTSATTVRNDGVNVVESLFENNSIEEFPLSMAIARKVLPCPHYITAIYRLDDEFEKLKKRIEASTNTKEEKREFYEKMKIMQSHFEKSYGIPTILNKYIKVKNGRYLVFCKDKKHLDSMRDIVIDWFKTAGTKDIHSYAVFSDYPDKEKDYKEFCADISNSAKILFSINMLNEGLHIKDISGVLMLRTTQSHLIYLQQLGRLVDADNIDKYLLVFDFVNNFSRVNDGIGMLREIKAAVAKEKESDPDFDDDGFEDIDTFFVLEQVVEIQEMFREIEGRLQDDWDAMFREYCKFYEENGHGDVPKTEEYKKLSNWCAQNRINRIQNNISEERIFLLNDKKFIWNINKHRLMEKANKVIDFFKVNNRFPVCGENWTDGTDIGNFLTRIRDDRRKYVKTGKCLDYKKEIFKLFDSCNIDWEPSNRAFDNFYYFLSEYNKEYGDVNIITSTEIYKDYPLGQKCSTYRGRFNNNQLTKEQIEKLNILGFNFLYKRDIERDYKYSLIEECIEREIIISNENRKYKDVDLYEWIKTTEARNYKNGKLTRDQETKIEKVLGYSISVFGNRKKIKRIQVLKNGQSLGVYNSSCDLSRNSIKDFGVHLSGSSIRCVCNGKYKQHKGFTFLYVK